MSLNPPSFVETGLQEARLFIWQQEAGLSIVSENCLLGVLTVFKETLLGICHFPKYCYKSCVMIINLLRANMELGIIFQADTLCCCHETQAWSMWSVA